MLEELRPGWSRARGCCAAPACTISELSRFRGRPGVRHPRRSTGCWLGSLCGGESENGNLNWQSELERCGVKAARARVCFCFSSPSSSFQLGSGCAVPFEAAARALCVDRAMGQNICAVWLVPVAVLSHALEELWFSLSMSWPCTPGIPGNRCSEQGPGALLSTESVFAVALNPISQAGVSVLAGQGECGAAVGAEGKPFLSNCL